jgi:FKBP-type peptidyl-prolyl cis-trans isomerase FklB
MKKTILLAMVLVAGAVSTAAWAGDKKDKKTKVEAPVERVSLRSTSDSVSYAAGYSATQGLLMYLQQRLNVDTAFMDDFERGYRDAMSKQGDKAYKAYQAGGSIAEQVTSQILPSMKADLEGTPDSISAALFNQGFIDGINEDTTFYNMSSARALFEGRIKEVKDAQNAAYKAENEAWLKTNATKAGVTVLPSGLQYKVIKQGTGAVPTKEQTVDVVYEGKTIDGNVFDATARHNGAKFDSFRCDQVIKGWTEALTMMPVGSKWEIYIPQNLAYGERQAGNIKPYSTLIFTVELVSIQADKAETAAPKASDTTAKPATKATVRTAARRK